MSFKEKHNSNLVYNTCANSVPEKGNIVHPESSSAVESSIKDGENMDDYANKETSSLCCRICFQSESDINNPLIAPCKCSGTMKYIHLSCLKNSVNLKINKKNNNNNF